MSQTISIQASNCSEIMEFLFPAVPLLAHIYRYRYSESTDRYKLNTVFKYSPTM